MLDKTVSHRSPTDFEYDVCFSFAGDDRAYVEEVAEELKKRAVKVFYDKYEKANLWGKDLYVHLDEVYRKAAYYCVLFASASYAKKLWTNHERASAQARAFEQNQEYILPAKFDDTEIPGLRPTVGYIRLSETSPKELAELIVEKLGSRVFSNFLPPEFDLVHKMISPNTKKVRERTSRDIRSFFHTLKRMTHDERTLIFKIFFDGCEHELPENIHIEENLITRTAGLTMEDIKKTLFSLSSLGFRYKIRKHKKKNGTDNAIYLEWHNLTIDEPEDANSTLSVYSMFCAVSDVRCEQCRWTALDNLDFSSLSSATISNGHIHN